eukprot:Gb_20757 [translate_table: standard]
MQHSCSATGRSSASLNSDVTRSHVPCKHLTDPRRRSPALEDPFTATNSFPRASKYCNVSEHTSCNSDLMSLLPNFPRVTTARYFLPTDNVPTCNCHVPSFEHHWQPFNNNTIAFNILRDEVTSIVHP